MCMCVRMCHCRWESEGEGEERGRRKGERDRRRGEEGVRIKRLEKIRRVKSSMYVHVCMHVRMFMFMFINSEVIYTP